MEVGLGEPKGAPGSHVGTKQPNLGLMRRGGLGSVSKWTVFWFLLSVKAFWWFGHYREFWQTMIGTIQQPTSVSITPPNVVPAIFVVTKTSYFSPDVGPYRLKPFDTNQSQLYLDLGPVGCVEASMDRTWVRPTDVRSDWDLGSLRAWLMPWGLLHVPQANSWMIFHCQGVNCYQECQGFPEEQ